MSSINTCIYPTLDHLPDRTLQLHFTPSEAEQAFCKQHAKILSQQVCFLVMLKVTQYLYRAPKCDTIPYAVIRQVNQTISHQRFTKAALIKYGASGARSKHLAVIRRYLNLKPIDKTSETFMYQSALKTAKTKSNLTDIVNATIEYLVREQFELPELTAIEHCAHRASKNINDHLYAEIANLLTVEQKHRIDELMVLYKGNTTDWQRIKTSPKKPKPTKIKHYLAYVGWLKPLIQDIQLPKDLPIAKLEQFRDDARSSDASMMKRLNAEKRYALAVVLMQYQLADALDNLVTIFIRLIQEIEITGKRLYNEYYLQERDRSDRLIGDFHGVLSSLSHADNEQETLSVIHAEVDPNLDRWLNACDQHLFSSLSKHAPFMMTAYRNKRALIFDCLEALSIQACINDQTLINCWQFILKHKEDRSKNLSIKPEGATRKEISTNWINKMWHALLAPHDDHFSDATHLSKDYLETCLFCQMKEELISGDLFIEGGYEYSDDTQRFVDDETLKSELPEYGDLVQLPTDPKAFVKSLRKDLRDLCVEVDKKFPNIEEAWFDNGVLKLKQIRSPNKKKVNDALDARLKKTLERVSIIDVIADTVNWLNLDHYFQPLSENKRRLTDAKKHLVSSLFCYGCNLGPSQTAECLKGISRKQIAWLNLRNASEKQLLKAIKKVVNTYQKMEIAKFWGQGQSISADGTHRRTCEENLLSQFHFRYRKKGMICYFLTSDNYICLFSHFIPCGVHESNYILDGLSQNDMDIQPNKIHGDTHAQTLSTFGLSYLLGFKLMPRIGKIKKLKFFKTTDDLKLKNIGRLFKGTINWQLIEDYLPEMYRTVISIKKGIVTPSAMLRRAGGRSRKNRRYYAFQELGKVIRTIFLLRYISDYELRQYIHRETNKSEQFNNFVKWVAFHNDGLVAEDHKHEQQKIVKYQHLVANLVILYNAEKMGRALKQIIDDGFEVNKKNMSHLSPFWTSHINRLGEYRLNADREVEPINFSFDLPEFDSSNNGP